MSHSRFSRLEVLSWPRFLTSLAPNGGDTYYICPAFLQHVADSMRLEHPDSAAVFEQGGSGLGLFVTISDGPHCGVTR